MKNKRKAIYEVLGHVVECKQARQMFYNVYEFLLYNDTKGFLELLDFRMGIAESNKAAEEYHLLKYMLQLLQDKYPQKIKTLTPS